MNTKRLVLSLMTLLVYFIPLQAEDLKDEMVKVVYQCDFEEPERINLLNEYQQ